MPCTRKRSGSPNGRRCRSPSWAAGGSSTWGAGGGADVALAELVPVELSVLLRNPAVVPKPLEGGEAASLCQAFRRHPHWALIHTAAGMDRVWAAAARPGGARRHIFDPRLAHTLLDNGGRG